VNAPVRLPRVGNCASGARSELISDCGSCEKSRIHETSLRTWLVVGLSFSAAGRFCARCVPRFGNELFIHFTSSTTQESVPAGMVVQPVLRKRLFHRQKSRNPVRCQTDKGAGLNQEEADFPTLPGLRKQRPQSAVQWREAESMGPPAQNQQLAAQSQVLQ
jgi:hypothetical protein